VTDTFPCTGGEQTWTVPAGVNEATFVVEGASGGVLGNTPPPASCVQSDEADNRVRVVSAAH
jgi:hypothetical protein